MVNLKSVKAPEDINRVILIEDIKRHEGYSLRPYRDTLGKWTIGWGHLLEDHQMSAIEQTVGEFLDFLCNKDTHTVWLAEDLGDAEETARAWMPFEALSEPRRRLLIEMCFVLGGTGARKFKRFERAVMENDHHTAAIEIKNSLWYTQAPNRVGGFSQRWAQG